MSDLQDTVNQFVDEMIDRWGHYFTMLDEITFVLSQAAVDDDNFMKTVLHVNQKNIQTIRAAGASNMVFIIDKRDGTFSGKVLRKEAVN